MVAVGLSGQMNFSSLPGSHVCGFDCSPACTLFDSKVAANYVGAPEVGLGILNLALFISSVRNSNLDERGAGLMNIDVGADFVSMSSMAQGA
jgi:hypothetical protein